jgi:hypothetical protein
MYIDFWKICFAIGLGFFLGGAVAALLILGMLSGHCS